MLTKINFLNDNNCGHLRNKRNFQCKYVFSSVFFSCSVSTENIEKSLRQSTKEKTKTYTKIKANNLS